MDKNSLPVELQALDIPGWVRWLAQDEDGTWWGYEVEPHQHHCGWYENELGRNIRLFEASPANDWHLQLRQVK